MQRGLSADWTARSLSTTRVTYKPKLPKLYSKAGGIADHSIVLYDVGASGGLDEHWLGFGEVLQAVAFDPLVTEIERLNRENQNPNFSFIDAFIGGPNDAEQTKPTPSKGNYSFERTSAAEAGRVVDQHYATEVFNRGAPVVWSKRRLSLDKFTADNDVNSVDFIKVDTDGEDFAVLEGSIDTLRRTSVLGLSIEVQFHGDVGDKANVFSNIDRFVRNQGFTLFDLEVYRYTRAALPGQFAYSCFGPTVDGQAQYGDAVYFRDLADPEYSRKFEFELTPAKILKCVCLLEGFGQNDSAAELLLAHRKTVESHIDLSEWLDTLTPSAANYEEHVGRFRNDPQSFMKSADSSESSSPSPNPRDSS